MAINANKIKQIKAFRYATLAGLKDAKEMIELSWIMLERRGGFYQDDELAALANVGNAVRLLSDMRARSSRPDAELVTALQHAIIPESEPVLNAIAREVVAEASDRLR